MHASFHTISLIFLHQLPRMQSSAIGRHSPQALHSPRGKQVRCSEVSSAHTVALAAKVCVMPVFVLLSPLSSQPARSSRTLGPATARTAHPSQRHGGRFLLVIILVQFQRPVSERIAAAHSSARARARSQPLVPHAPIRSRRARGLEHTLPRVCATGVHERQRVQKVSFAFRCLRRNACGVLFMRF